MSALKSFHVEHNPNTIEVDRAHAVSSQEEYLWPDGMDELVKRMRRMLIDSDTDLEQQAIGMPVFNNRRAEPDSVETLSKEDVDFVKFPVQYPDGKKMALIRYIIDSQEVPYFVSATSSDVN